MNIQSDPSVDILQRWGTSVPKWLSDYQPSRPFSLKEFLKSRTFFYPCSGTEGNPLRVFSKAHAAHSFVYVDHRRDFLDEVRVVLRGSMRPKGYELFAEKALQESDILPDGWCRHLEKSAYESETATDCMGLFVVLQRATNHGEDHGPERLSILHLKWDALAAFDALYCQKGRRFPYGVLVEPYYGGGFSGGPDCPLWDLIVQRGVKPPRWLLVGENANPWPGYEWLCEARISYHRPTRSLFKRRTVYRHLSGSSDLKIL